MAPILLCLLFLAIFIAFNQRKNKLLQQQEVDRQQYQEALTNAKLEIKDETLKRVAHELHDNVGQLLSLAKIYLVGMKENQPHQNKLHETDELVDKALLEIRTLSKMLNADWAKNFSLHDSLQLLLQWIEKSGSIKTTLDYNCRQHHLSADEELILFRICQEFLNNSLKYAQCKTITLSFHCSPLGYSLTLEDDGCGFDQKQIVAGSGLSNFEQRAALLKCLCNLESELGKGTKLVILKK